MTNGEILVVDDMPANLDVVSQVLEDAGYEVAMATDGNRALKLVKNHPPDLILLDIQMPVMNGFETCQHLKENPQTATIPVMFMTALNDTDSKIKGFDLGAVDYITKPFQERELLARVKTHLQLRQWSKTLEAQVAERTQTLQTALEQLKQSQMQLVQSEKLSSLGNIVAGVAHEINNPVNFIHGNLTYVQNYARDLLELVQLYEQHYRDPVEAIQTKAEEIDLEFVEEDLPKTLASMKLGSDRIRAIVCSLRNFSRADEAETKAADIHEGLDSTLTILGHRLKSHPDRPKVVLTKDYGDLPSVECYPGLLNQVFMNVLSNALDTLEEKWSHQRATGSSPEVSHITLRTTQLDDQWVQIAIADNGLGIPPDIQSEIFAPFFTTKPVGKGTGLGMSISYQIVTEKHRGKLTCFSTPNEGTEFVIQIPLRQSRVSLSAPH